MNNKIITVSQLNRYVKTVLEENNLLNEVYIKGEISNFVNHYRSGHMYFSLKDDKASIKAVMFASNASLLKFLPEDGLSVIVRANVSLYEKDGAYQAYVLDMQPDGLGSLNLAYEQLKDKLQKEGLFNPSNKKLIPSLPKNIGVVTAPTGAALQDILNILDRQYPIGNVRIYPATVQGKLAAPSIVKAIKYICKEKICDVIILARGGGSLEDLWAFNEEKVVRAIFESTIPIITGVGHETDYTLSDFASDLRGETPSAAATLAARNITQLRLELDSIEQALRNIINNKIEKYESTMRLYDINRLNQSLERVVSINQKIICELSDDLIKTQDAFLNKKEDKMLYLAKIINGLSPLAILQRGYSITTEQGKKTIDDVAIGDKIISQTKNITIYSTVDNVLENS
ncbi:MAG: exodeoxyribonuclease VII large subunit [Oscillospiraceae bacterium]